MDTYMGTCTCVCLLDSLSCRRLSTGGWQKKWNTRWAEGLTYLLLVC